MEVTEIKLTPYRGLHGRVNISLEFTRPAFLKIEEGACYHLHGPRK